MIKFQSINQFRNVVKEIKRQTQYVGSNESGPIYDQNITTFPILKYQGTIKLHGTHSGIVFDVSTREISYQSRERVLTLQQDNAGFMSYMMKYEKVFKDYFGGWYADDNDDLSQVVLFGEWCGQGIQKGVAVSELPKMFVVFAVKNVYRDGSSEWCENFEDLIADLVYDHLMHERREDMRIFSIYDFPTFRMSIDFNNPGLAQNEMIKITEAVEAECPVGKSFILSAIVGNSCVIKDDYRLEWVNSNVESLSSYNEIRSNIIKVIKDRNIAIGSVIQLGV